MRIYLILFIWLLPMNVKGQSDSINLSPHFNPLVPIEETIPAKIGDKIISIKKWQYGNNDSVFYINLHDNEYTSVMAAKILLEKNGGILIKIENNSQREIRFKVNGARYAIDPNRIFSRIGIEQTLKYHGRISQPAIEAVESFSQSILLQFPEKTDCIIALHNNSEDAYSVKSYLPGNEKQFDAKAVYVDSLQDPDDIVFTTDSILYQKMADNRYNAIWQDNFNAKRDGSLSIYCAEKGKRYINIETQHGKVTQYIDMLEKLLAILNKENNKIDNTSISQKSASNIPKNPVDN